MVVGVPFRFTVRPTSERSRPKRRFHSPSPIMATLAAPGFSSASSKARPATGCTPSRRSSDGLMRLPESCSGSPPPLSVMVLKPTAAMPSRLRACSRQLRKLSTDAAKTGRFSLSLRSATCTRRSGWPNGRGRRITALTTLKIAVLAAIASAMVRTTVVVNSGVLDRTRRA